MSSCSYGEAGQASVIVLLFLCFSLLVLPEYIVGKIRNMPMYICYMKAFRVLYVCFSGSFVI